MCVSECVCVCLCVFVCVITRGYPIEPRGREGGRERDRRSMEPKKTANESTVAGVVTELTWRPGNNAHNTRQLAATTS